MPLHATCFAFAGPALLCYSHSRTSVHVNHHMCTTTCSMDVNALQSLGRPAVLAVLDGVEGRVREAGGARGAGDRGWWRLREAALLALGGVREYFSFMCFQFLLMLLLYCRSSSKCRTNLNIVACFHPPLLTLILCNDNREIWRCCFFACCCWEPAAPVP